MSRRGRCRCGLMLTFRRTAQGYKMRCPSCGAVVRLRVQKKRRMPPGDGAPAATDLPPGGFDVELVPVALPTPPPAEPPRRKRWTAALLAGAVLMGVVGGAVWWFLR